MLNENKERELAYVVIIDNITPIPGYDRVELAHVGGWTVVVGKGEFTAGDPAIYFEIDSKLPEVEPFINMDFLAKKHFMIKTQKMCKSISQGLLMSADNFGWTKGRIYTTGAIKNINSPYIKDNEGHYFFVDDESRFLTKRLGVTYAVVEDNKRKAKSVDKYKSMAQRHNKLFAKRPFRWLMKREWGKKLLFIFFGKKKDKKSEWPGWVKKTDEERVENMSWILNNKEPWIATEKIDGTSTTFTLIKKGKIFKKEKFYVCSRNVVFDKPDKSCFYDTNVYLEMAEKYHIKNILSLLLKYKFPDCEWITIQGETYGAGIQKRDYGLTEHKFMAFNLITSKHGRFNSVYMTELFSKYIPCVPIVNSTYILPDSIEELRNFVDSQKSTIDGEMREGIVFRSQDGTQSFKCVSPTYLMKYHG